MPPKGILVQAVFGSACARTPPTNATSADETHPRQFYHEKLCGRRSSQGCISG
jgi:hypothetical protein